MKKQIAVFGLDHFGGNLVKEFHTMGIEVMAVDKNEQRVNEYVSYTTLAVVANITDEKSLTSLGVKNVDLAIVSFGDDIEASILTSLMLKELGVSEVWAHANDKYHEKVLERIGVSRIINPEKDTAKRMVHLIVSERVMDYIELSDEYSIIEILASPKIHRKTLLDLNVRRKYGCSIIVIKRGKELIVSPRAEEEILADDILFLIGNNKDIERFHQKEV